MTETHGLVHCQVEVLLCLGTDHHWVQGVGSSNPIEAYLTILRFILKGSLYSVTLCEEVLATCTVSTYTIGRIPL